MAVSKRLKIGMGLKYARKPKFASEPGFVDAVNAQIAIMTREVESIFSQFVDVSGEVMLNAMKPVFDQSQEIVPVRTGDLKESGYLEDTSTTSQPRVEIGYARGGNPRYAVVVHEDLTAYHRPPTQAKFLERPVMSDLQGIYQRLADGYKTFMGTSNG